MTRKSVNKDNGKSVSVEVAEVKNVLEEQKDFLVPMVQEAMQAVLEMEMEETLGAGRYERAEGRVGYRSGHYRRRLITRVGTIQLRVPQDRSGHFSTQVFEQYQRSEKALVGALAQMYVQGVSTRKVAAITEELCGHQFSASSISEITRRLDEQLQQKIPPTALALAVGILHRQHLPPAFPIDPQRNQNRPAHDQPLLTHPLIPRVQNHIRIFLP